jgi:hypothetical protein
MMTTLSWRPAISARSAFASVVLPEPVPPAIRMLRASVTAVVSTFAISGEAICALT